MLKQVNRSEPSLHLNEINIDDKYKFIQSIGKGSYGEVWLVVPLRQPSSTKSTSKQYVLKRLDLRQQSYETTENDLEGAEREAKLLSKLKHPNIVAYIESFRSSDNFLNIVMAYCEGGDLYTKLKELKQKQNSLTETQIVEWFIQITMALQYMHDRSILHRDLKTQNIFLTKNGIVKVGDLGIAKVLESGNDLATTIIGTPYYMSPEIFSHVPYGQKSDIWALGCCAFEMVTLQHAFNAKDMNSLMLKIIRGQLPRMSRQYSETLTNLIRSMLSKNPDDRPTAKEILQNSFIKQNIMQLLEKTKIKCQNQNNSNSQVAPVVPQMPPPPPLPVLPYPSSPPRSSSSSDIRQPYSSASSPSSKKPPSSRFPNNTPALPSYPPLPPSNYQRPTNPVTSSSSSSDPSRSLPTNEIPPSNGPRARRRDLLRQNNPLPIEDQQMDMQFISKVSQNDTIQRRKREQQINNHLKQHQPISSDDEHEINPSQPVVVVVPPKKTVRPHSAASSIESNYSKVSYEDENYSHERQSQIQQPKTAKSYDVNNNLPNENARQRRRDNRTQSSIESSSSSSTYPTTTGNSNNGEPTQELNTEEIEKKKEGEKDMNDFLFMLTATLKLARGSSSSSSSTSIRTAPDPKELTNSSNDDSDRTVVNKGYSQSPIQEPIAHSWQSMDQTMDSPLHETSCMYRRYQALKRQCLEEINWEQLQRVLAIIDNVTESQMQDEIIDELGVYLYDKYASQIYLLKFYEDSLRNH